MMAMTRTQMVRPGARLNRRRGLMLLAALLVAPALPGGAAGACRIAVLGDSLTSAYGLPLEEGFPARLEAALRARGHDCVIVDAGVSGDTSAGGRARLDWVLADRPSHLLVELGANDALRALPPEQLEANLDAIVATATAQGVAVMLAGMLAPPNLGEAYGEAFAAAYRRVASRHGVPLYPFFLDGVAAVPELNQSDGIHPNARGVREIVQRILPAIEAWVGGPAPQPSTGG